ncbi:MAG TPA: replicative DNA helicase, partial [Bacillota bacterium]|nr:replicative DNA helicase [Bacillota bacterium]
MSIDRVPPHSVEAERSVLGAILLDKESLISLSVHLQPTHFYREIHRQIYQVMLDLYIENEPVDLITVSDRLAGRGKLDDVGGITFLSELADSTPVISNAPSYAKIVYDKFLLRQLISLGSDIVASSFDASEETSALLEQAEQRIFKLSQLRESRDAVPLVTILHSIYDSLNAATIQGAVSGVPTGYSGLDRLTHGFQKGDLCILAARPSVGKTALSLNIAMNAAVRGNVPVAFFSLEMPREQLALRMLCAESVVRSEAVRNGSLTDKDWERLARGIQDLSSARIFIDDTPSLPVMEMRSKARRLKAEHNIGLVVVDYLQLLRHQSRSENRQQEVAEITRILKATARELEVPVLALAQLSRASEQRSDRRPNLSDLRDSGEIDQAYDLVMFIYREYYQNQQAPSSEGAGLVVIILGSHR